MIGDQCPTDACLSRGRRHCGLQRVTDSPHRVGRLQRALQRGQRSVAPQDINWNHSAEETSAAGHQTG